MIRAAAVVLGLMAQTAFAEPTGVSYQGMTLGAPIPPGVVANWSEEIGGSAGLDRPSPFDRACAHEFLPDATGGTAPLTVLTSGCDGPVISIGAQSATGGFFEPDPMETEGSTGIPVLTFDETTLADVRQLMCSEGIIAYPIFGQINPDPLGTFTLAYEIEGQPAVVTFLLSLPFHYFGINTQSDEAPDRDTATLSSIRVMDRTLFDIFVRDNAEFSPGYVAVPLGLLSPAGTTPLCPTS